MVLKTSFVIGVLRNIILAGRRKLKRIFIRDGNDSWARRHPVYVIKATVGLGCSAIPPLLKAGSRCLGPEQIRMELLKVAGAFVQA